MKVWWMKKKKWKRRCKRKSLYHRSPIRPLLWASENRHATYELKAVSFLDAACIYPDILYALPPGFSSQNFKV